jgi:hypothetical protein
MFDPLGFLEMLVIGILTLAFPVGILYSLYAIYKKLKSIDEQLKKTKNDK